MIKSTVKITSEPWGEYAGQPVYLFKIEHANGSYIELTNYGATLVSAVVPDADGHYGHVVLGFDSLQAYVDDRSYLGSTIGRYANRIGGAKFMMDDVTYHLEKNDGQNTNHGGNNGFNSQVFDSFITDDGISFQLKSEDGDGGYPGNLDLTVNYQFTEFDELIITYQAITDKKTVANFTNHAYFNLSNDGSKVFDHSLKVYADQVLEKNAAYIPTGLIRPAAEIAFDGNTIRSRMTVNDDGITGLNDCYLLPEPVDTLHKLAAELYEKQSGRRLEIYTTYPAVMVYTADYLQSEHLGHGSIPYRPFDGVCLECQYYPDSPNHLNFPATILEPGEVYHEAIIYKFSTTV